MLLRMLRGRNPYIPQEIMQTGITIIKISWSFLKKISKNITMIQLYHFWVYTQGTLKSCGTEISTHPYSLQHISQHSCFRIGLSVYQQHNQ